MTTSKIRTAAVVGIAAAVLAGTMGAVSNCTGSNTPNGDATPQPGHTTIIGPTPSGSARASIIPNPSPRPYVSPSNQADADRLKALHPTVLCNDGYLGWPLKKQGACLRHRGISTWYGVSNI